MLSRKAENDLLMLVECQIDLVDKQTIFELKGHDLVKQLYTDKPFQLRYFPTQAGLLLASYVRDKRQKELENVNVTA